MAAGTEDIDARDHALKDTAIERGRSEAPLRGAERGWQGRMAEHFVARTVTYVLEMQGRLLVIE